jgi:hypothetical protein
MALWPRHESDSGRHGLRATARPGYSQPRFPAVRCDRLLPGAGPDQRLAGYFEAIRPAKPVECLLDLGEDPLSGRALQPIRGCAREGGHIEPVLVEGRRN